MKSPAVTFRDQAGAQMRGVMFKTVLVGADSSVTASRAVSTAVELVKAVGGTLHVITAYKPPDPPRLDKLPEEFFDRP